MGMQQPQVVYASPPGAGDNNIAMLQQQKLAAQRLAGIQKSFNKKVPPMDRLFKKMGLDVSLKGMLKQSQIFTGTLGAIFQLIGAGIDMFLAPMLPMIIPFIRKMVKALPVFKKLGEQMRDLIMGFSRAMDSIIPNFIKKMGGGWWIKAIIAILGVIAFKAGIGMGGRFLGRQAGKAVRAGGSKVAQRFGRTAATSSSSSSIIRAGSSATDALTGRQFTAPMNQVISNTGKISRFSFWKKVFTMGGLLAGGGLSMGMGGGGGGGVKKPQLPEGADGSKWKWPELKMPKWLNMDWFTRPEWLKSFMSMNWFKPGKWFDDLLSLFGKTPTPKVPPTTKVVLPEPPPTTKVVTLEPAPGTKIVIEDIPTVKNLTAVATIADEIIDNYSSSRYAAGTGDIPNIPKNINVPNTPVRNIPTPTGQIMGIDRGAAVIDKYNMRPTPTTPTPKNNYRGGPFGGGSPLNRTDVDLPSKLKLVPVTDITGRVRTFTEVPPSAADLGRNVSYDAIQAKNLAAEKVGTTGVDEATKAFSNVDVVSSGSKIKNALSMAGGITKTAAQFLPAIDAVMDTNDTFNLATNTRNQVEAASGQNVPVINQVAVEGVLAVNALKDAGLGVLETILIPLNLLGAGVVTASIIKYDDMAQRKANDMIQALTTVTVGTTKYSGGGDTANEIATFNEAVQMAQKYGGKAMGAMNIPGGEGLATSAETYIKEHMTLGPVKTEQVVDENTQALLNLSIIINSQTVAQNNREFNMQMQRETESTGGSYQGTTGMYKNLYGDSSPGG